MAFEATKREWGELYAFFRLLADGHVYTGTPEGKQDGTCRLPVALVQREEHNGTRLYFIGKNDIRLQGTGMDKHMPREAFGKAADLILQAVHESKTDEVSSPGEVENLLDEAVIYDLEARTDDRTDFKVAFYDAGAPLEGFRVYARTGTMCPLLDGGRCANFKFEQTGVKFPAPAVGKINAEAGVLERMRMIERLGGVLKYNDVADKIFRSNLSMIDLHMGRLLGEMTRLMWLEDVTGTATLTEEIKRLNPLKIKDELIGKHGFYEYKVKEFLLAIATGMRPAKVYNGVESAINGCLLVAGSGEVLCYRRAERQTFADFLFRNTRLERSSTEKDKYGYLERENGSYYFKLNLKVGLTKR